MPAKSKAQRRLFALALKFKEGKLENIDVSDEVKELSKLPDEILKDYAGTAEKNLPSKVDESINEDIKLVAKYIPQIKKKFKNFIEKNNLNTDFKSPNAIPFDTTFREYDNLTSSNASKNDSSWLEKGQEVIRGREDEMNVSARAIQAKWKTHLKKDSLEESTSDKLKPKT